MTWLQADTQVVIIIIETGSVTWSPLSCRVDDSLITPAASQIWTNTRQSLFLSVNFSMLVCLTRHLYYEVALSFIIYFSAVSSLISLFPGVVC